MQASIFSCISMLPKNKVSANTTNISSFSFSFAQPIACAVPKGFSCVAKLYFKLYFFEMSFIFSLFSFSISEIMKTTSFILFFVAFISVLIGYLIQKKIPEKLFFNIVYILLFLSGAKLIYDGVF